MLQSVDKQATVTSTLVAKGSSGSQLVKIKVSQHVGCDPPLGIK